jgi:hypothetical protein
MKWQEVRNLQDEELRNLDSSESIIRTVKQRRIRWKRHVARMGGGGTSVYKSLVRVGKSNPQLA